MLGYEGALDFDSTHFSLGPVNTKSLTFKARAIISHA
jgi:hypothetical protein